MNYIRTQNKSNSILSEGGKAIVDHFLKYRCKWVHQIQDRYFYFFLMK